MPDPHEPHGESMGLLLGVLGFGPSMVAFGEPRRFRPAKPATAAQFSERRRRSVWDEPGQHFLRAASGFLVSFRGWGAMPEVQAV